MSTKLDRRALLIGGACLAAAGTAYGLEPRRKLTLLQGAKMETIVPVAFPGWSAEASNGFVQPKAEGLAATLYNEVVQRAYRSDVLDATVMVLIAYGGTQSDLLQLHRPEVCYPALGFQIRSKAAAPLTLPGGGVLPIVRVVAVSGDRVENIVYWTRLGEDLPTSGSGQRAILLRDAMQGFVPDGVLVRSSLISEDSEAAFKVLDSFVPAMLASIGARNRPALIGTAATKAMPA